MAGTKTKSASKTSSKKNTASKQKTAPAKSQRPLRLRALGDGLKGGPAVESARTPSTTPEPARPKDAKLDREQHVHTERAEALLPTPPASVVVPSVEEMRLQDALSKQKK